MTPETRIYTTKEGGDEYALIFTHRALITAEQSAKCGIGQLLSEFSEGGLRSIASLLHGGLIVNQPEITFDAALELWETEGPNLVKAMAEALNAAMPTVAKMMGIKLRPRKGAAQQAATPPGTGSRSSRRGAKRG